MNTDDPTYDDGYEEGYEDGKQEGYDDGFADAKPKPADVEIVRAFLEAVELGNPDTANEALAALARMEDCK